MAAFGSLAANVYNAYQNKKTNNRLVEEKIRHNKVLEGRGLRGVKRKGKGVYMNRKKRGDGVYMSRTKSSGNGLLEELLRKKKKLR